MQRLDRLVVHVDVDVVVHLSLVVAHQPLQRAELILELVEGTTLAERTAVNTPLQGTAAASSGK